MTLKPGQNLLDRWNTKVKKVEFFTGPGTDLSIDEELFQLLSPRRIDRQVPQGRALWRRTTATTSRTMTGSEKGQDDI
jgi:hypothetical protein